MSGTFGRRVSVHRLLLLVALVAACATACVVVAPALATNEPFGCSSCAETNGAENYVTNTEGINYSEKGSCSAVWRNNGGGNWTKMARGCAGGKEKSWACDGNQNVKGHGEVEAESGNGNLGGRQDNFTYCG